MAHLFSLGIAQTTLPADGPSVYILTEVLTKGIFDIRIRHYVTRFGSLNLFLPIRENIF